MRISKLIVAALCAFSALAAAGADFPAGPVKLVHGLPGGLVDAGARALGELLSAKWKQPVVVDGKPGVSEMLAADAVARAPADGLTLLVASESAFVNNDILYRKPVVNAQRDLVPVCELFEIPFALIVRADLNVATLQDFVALMKKDGKAYSYASSGIGSPLHLAMEGLARSAGFEMVHVPYKTIGQLAQDMMGRRIDAAFLGVSSAMTFVKSGKLKMLAVTGAARSGAAPAVPTFGELGYRTVDYRTTIALAAPRGTPAPTLARIEADVREALNSPEYAKSFLDPQDLKPGSADARRLADLLAERRKTTRQLIETLGVSLD